MLSTCLRLSHAPAGVASSATIAEGSGSTSGAVLKVLRPASVSDDTVASYMIRAYTDAEGSTKVRDGMSGELRVQAAAAGWGQGRNQEVWLWQECADSGWWLGGAHSPPCPQFGEEVRGSNTATGADGLSLATAFAFPYPYTTAAKLWFKVTVVVGGTRSDASPIYGPIIMGALMHAHVVALLWCMVAGAGMCSCAAVHIREPHAQHMAVRSI